MASGAPTTGTTGRGPQPSEAEIQQALAMSEQYRAHLDALEQQRAYLTQVLTDYTQGQEALAELKKAEAGEEVLLPVGGGVFVRATLAEHERVLTSLGSNLHAEASIDQAIERLGERIQSLEKTRERLAEETTRVAGEVSRVNAFLNQLSGR